jgi:eukaryotic-like serine/threonine-protein kinase
MQPQLIAGRYQVLRAIGRGGMGTVWLCRDQILGREVAVKQIGALPGESATEAKRAMREARSAASINHPNAVAVYDVADHDGRPWLVMEYVEGETLADEIARDGQLSPQRVADIGAQLAGALARAHQRRIVHRDIKPGNVLIDKAGRPKISDFGIARGHGDEQLTQVGFITGTPGFLSPELARGGDPHPASDVWALGATLYAAVEGRPPYEPCSNPIALLRAIAAERPRPMTHAGALAPAIEAMMHEDPACRWDMATSARRLGGIARAGAPAYLSRADPTVTKVIGAPLLESTQPLEPTQSLAASVPLAAAAPVAVALVAARPVVKAPVVEVPAVKPPVAAKVVIAEPVVAKAPLDANPVTAAPVVAKAPLAANPAPAAPAVAKVPAVVLPVAKSPVVAKPPVVEAPLVNQPVVHKPSVAEPPSDRGSRRHRKPVLLGALLAGVLGVAYLLSPIGDQGGPAATPTATQVTPSAKPTTTRAPGASETPSATTPAPSSPVAKPAPSGDKQLANFVSAYFAGVTSNRDSTWVQLSPKMQDSAGGRSVYNGWWTTVRSVTVQNVQANAAAKTAVVTLTYNMMDGSRSTETNAYTFVKNGAGYRIQSQSGH